MNCTPYILRGYDIYMTSPYSSVFQGKKECETDSKL